MPKALITVETDVQESFRVASMRGMYDLTPEKKLRHQWDVDIPIEGFDWTVGLIVGASGSGKTTIGRELWGSAAMHSGFWWHDKKSVLDGFPAAMETKEIVDLLCHVGFSSPPSWAKPFKVLSNGQKFRVELARVLADDRPVVVIDEFTSVVDRNAAKVGSHAIAKTARKRKRQIVCLSCHRDIIEWLEPDWVYDTDLGKFQRGSLQRPEIRLDIHQCDRSAWPLFRDHHYLSGDIASAAQCFVAFMDGVPVAFTSYLHSAGHFGIKREHRTVVLPDYQGMGIGVALSEWLGDRLTKQGFRFTSSFSHPAFVSARVKSGKWKLFLQGHQKLSTTSDKIRSQSASRMTARMEYVGGNDSKKQ